MSVCRHGRQRYREGNYRTLFETRETKRVKRADNLGRQAYVDAGLELEFDAAIENVLACVAIRNQYAHCVRHDDLTGRLAFAHMEELAAPNGARADPGNLTFFYVDVGLFQEQERFFLYVMNTLTYLNYKRRQLVGKIEPGAILRVPNPVPRPRMHL